MSILNIQFNQDNNILVCGTDRGFLVFKLSPNETSRQIASKFPGGIGLASILKKTNLFAIVGGGDKPYKLKEKMMKKGEL